MKINFYLPQVYRGVAGGYKVIYQYSNFLANEGFDINIYYDLNDGKNSKHIPKFLCKIIRRITFIGYPKWYKLNDNIKQYAVDNLSEKYISNADISIATTPNLAYKIKELSSKKGKKFYLIQGYENWDGSSDNYIHSSYSLGLNNIVISKWLKEIVDKYAQTPSVLVPNGLDLQKFKVKNSIENRNNCSIAMVYNDGENKGCKYALNVFYRLKKEYQELSVQLYGTPKRPKNLPEWIEYKKCATENDVIDFLNNSAIFVCSSIFEGFGLPGLEAMACGCALVTTDCKGPREYANENNAIFVNPKDEDELYLALKKLLDDSNFRKKIAYRGNKTSESWSIIESQKKFHEKLIETVIDEKN